MKERFNTKYIASVSEYDVPLTGKLCDKLQESINDVTRANQDGDVAKILRRPGEMLSNLNRTIQKLHSYSKGGPTGMLMGLSQKDDDDWTTAYKQAKDSGEPSFTYKGKRYPMTSEIDSLVAKLNPFKRKTTR